MSGGGLQPERTGLAWSRTSLAVATNAALLAAHELHDTSSRLGLLPAAAALLLAAATAIYGARRTRAMRGSATPRPARAAIPLLGWAVVALAVLTGAVLAFE